MGYTHYWRRPFVIPETQWNLFLEDCRAIAAHLPECTPTAGGYYADAPLVLDDGAIIDDDAVIFDGIGDLSHETFVMTRVLEADNRWQGQEGPKGLYFDFCKTARKPYDVVVVACLTALKNRVPQVILESDGTRMERHEGILLYQQATGNASLAWDADEQVRT